MCCCSFPRRSAAQIPDVHELTINSPLVSQRPFSRQTSAGSVHLRRQSTLCSSSGGQSALPQMVSSSQGGCSRLTHACIQAQTHVHACVHARVALASFAHGECSPCIHPHTRASKRRHACMRTCVHARMRHHGELCPWRALYPCRHSHMHTSAPCTPTHAHTHAPLHPYTRTFVSAGACTFRTRGLPPQASCGLPPAARVTHRRAPPVAV